MDNRELERRSSLTQTQAETEIAALIERERAERSGKLDTSGFPIEQLPEAIGSMDWVTVLRCSGMPVNDLGPLAGLPALAKLSCSFTPVSDLGPLSGLPALATLDCHDTLVSDLGPLAGLPALAKLYCSDTLVSDLGPLSGLPALATLDCHNTKVSDLGPLRDRPALAALNFNDTLVSDLGPLFSLPTLATLECLNTLVSDLSPLSGLTKLVELDCSGTSVCDLGPLCGLPALAILACNNTLVSDLGPLSSLPALARLYCGDTLVADLGPAICHPTITELVAFHLPKCQIPADVMLRGYGSDFLPRLRSWYANQQQGSEPFRRHKLFLLGNGTVGKTQLARRLRGLGFDASEPSTHGIQLHDCPLPASPDARHPDAGDSFDARIWDFGGQDIYHGTHALFLKSRAIFLICWEGESESAREHQTGGQTFRNYPLAYWLDYVRNLAGPQAQVIVVQTQTDRPGAPLEPDLRLSDYADLNIVGTCRTSAARGRGIESLKEMIADAVERIEKPALQLIGTPERRVIETIAARREAGERTLAQAQFADLCGETQLAGEPEHLLHFLHHSGEVFHAEGLFGDAIIIDQRWALEAIYAVFERADTAPLIRTERGRFTLSMLSQTVWRDQTEAEQERFLAMMLQCRMAFEYIEGEEGRREAVYIAPDLLPEFDDPAVQRWHAREWDPGDPGQVRAIPVPLLHDGLVRELMVGIGRDAGLWAVYWRNGVLFHDMKTRAIAVIEARWPDPDGWAGEIVITTQRSGAAALLDVLDRHVRRVAERLGVKLGDTPQDRVSPQNRPGIADDFDRARGKPKARDRDEPGAPEFETGRGAPIKPSCYVSYAWGDGTAQADANERLVDDLCEAAAARGIEIVRDKTHLATGASISAFTEEIARARTVATLIGERYWTRPDCFKEIYGCWTEAKQRPELFAEKIRDFIFADAGLYNPGAVQQVAEHWQAEFARCDAMRGTFRDRHAMLIAEQADSWVPQCRRIIAALQDKVRTYEGDFEAFKEQLFTELEKQRYNPDHARDA